MGYFANGTAGMDYQEKYCVKCVHWRSRGKATFESCPVWDLHQEYGYDRNASSNLNLAWNAVNNMSDIVLDTLIPMNNMGDQNKQCEFFWLDPSKVN